MQLRTITKVYKINSIKFYMNSKKFIVINVIFSLYSSTRVNDKIRIADAHHNYADRS